CQLVMFNTRFTGWSWASRYNRMGKSATAVRKKSGHAVLHMARTVGAWSTELVMTHRKQMPIAVQAVWNGPHGSFQLGCNTFNGSHHRCPLDQEFSDSRFEWTLALDRVERLRAIRVTGSFNVIELIPRSIGGRISGRGQRDRPPRRS